MSAEKPGMLLGDDCGTSFVDSVPAAAALFLAVKMRFAAAALAAATFEKTF